MDVATYLKRSGKSQVELARELGTSRGHVNDLLSGRRVPGKKTAQKLEAITGHAWWKWLGQS